MSCCGGKCDGPLMEQGTQPESRYPSVRKISADCWAAPTPPAKRQFGSAPCCCPGKGGCCGDPLKDFVYSGDYLSACDFPLGGFGAGNVILHGDGTLQQWNVLNQCRAETLPMHDIPACFFGISAAKHHQQPQSFVLASPETYTERTVSLPAGHPARVTGASVHRLQTLPGIKGLTLTGKFPVADVAYDIDGFPLQVSLEAMSPCVPTDTKNSSLPCAFFTFSLHNPDATVPVTAKVMEAQQNFVGWDGQKDCTQGKGKTPFWGGNVNTPFSGAGEGGCGAGIRMSSAGVVPDSSLHGTLEVRAVTDGACLIDGFGSGTGAAVSVIAGAETEQDLWSAFTAGRDVPVQGAPPTSPTPPGSALAAAVVQTVTVPPGTTVQVTFVLSWHFPNRTTVGSFGSSYVGKNQFLPAVLGNRYQTWFADASAVGDYAQAGRSMLLSHTRLYRDTIFATTIPPELLDSAAGRVAVMRSCTMWWTKQGIVMGCEGNGCCAGNCTHVYGYTTLMERLFPDVAKDMRISDFVRNYNPAVTSSSSPVGGCTMRFGQGGWAIDGALACILKTYLVVQQADSTLQFLPQVWPNVKDQMRRIQEYFDPAHGDGVIRLEQQNTYDTAMAGANTFIGSYYVTALRAMAEMATLMGESSSMVDAFRQRAALAAKNYDAICWNEKFGYYIADVTAGDCANSYGPGCFVDQLCAGGLSAALGFGYVFDHEKQEGAHEAAARRAVLKYNTVTKPPWNDMQKHMFDGDTGITVCQYPNGKLGNGMKYDTLVSTGFTSPNISGMLLDRNVDGALTFATNIRRRHDGRNRSPWNEPECNVLYSRAMAHWNIFDQCCGFRYDSTKGALAYDPRTNAEDFKCFTVLEGGWGQFVQQGGTGLPSGMISLKCLFGSFTINSLGVKSTATVAKATLDGAVIAIKSFAGGVVTFATPLHIAAGSTLSVTLTGGAEFAPTHALRQRRAVAALVSAASESATGGTALRGYPTLGVRRALLVMCIIALVIFGLGFSFAFFLLEDKRYQ